LVIQGSELVHFMPHHSSSWRFMSHHISAVRSLQADTPTPKIYIYFLNSEMNSCLSLRIRFTEVQECTSPAERQHWGIFCMIYRLRLWECEGAPGSGWCKFHHQMMYVRRCVDICAPPSLLWLPLGSHSTNCANAGKSESNNNESNGYLKLSKDTQLALSVTALGRCLHFKGVTVQSVNNISWL